MLFFLIADIFGCVTSVEASYLKTDMCTSESSPNQETRAQSTDSSKASSKPRAFHCHSNLIFIIYSRLSTGYYTLSHLKWHSNAFSPTGMVKRSKLKNWQHGNKTPSTTSSEIKC